MPNHALRAIIDERRERRAQLAADAAQVAPATASADGVRWRIDPAKLELSERVLGRGAWGVVRQGWLVESDGAEGKERTAVAVKMIPDAPSSVTDSLETELRTLALATLRCAHVCRLIGTCPIEGTCALVMKQYECSLHDVLQSQPGHRLPLPAAVRVGTQLARAVGELHECRIVLRDLKPSNVLLDKWGDLVVSDFGISEKLESSLSLIMPTSVKGTTCYMPPEAFDPEQFGGIGRAADIWSLGCCLLEALDGAPPFAALPYQQVMRRVCDKHEAPRIPEGLPSALQELLRSCFAYDPLRRPSAIEVHARLVACEETSLTFAGNSATGGGVAASQAGGTRPAPSDGAAPLASALGSPSASHPTVAQTGQDQPSSCERDGSQPAPMTAEGKEAVATMRDSAGTVVTPPATTTRSPTTGSWAAGSTSALTASSSAASAEPTVEYFLPGEPEPYRRGEVDFSPPDRPGDLADLVAAGAVAAGHRADAATAASRPATAACSTYGARASPPREAVEDSAAGGSWTPFVADGEARGIPLSGVAADTSSSALAHPTPGTLTSHTEARAPYGTVTGVGTGTGTGAQTIPAPPTAELIAADRRGQAEPPPAAGIERLVEMGFEHASVEAALVACEGDVAAAAAQLMQASEALAAHEMVEAAARAQEEVAAVGSARTSVPTCSTCNASLRPGYQFCTACGTPLPGPGPQEPPRDTTEPHSAGVDETGSSDMLGRGPEGHPAWHGNASTSIAEGMRMPAASDNAAVGVEGADAQAEGSGASVGGGVMWRVVIEWPENAKLGLALTDGHDGIATVASVAPSSAASAHLAVGDRIYSINGQRTPASDREAVVRMLLAAGSPLELEVQAPRSVEERRAAGVAGERGAPRRGMISSLFRGSSNGCSTRSDLSTA